jgi:hypothetical protein
MTQEEQIVYKVHLLEELVKTQSEQLDIADQIIDKQNILIDMTDETFLNQRKELVTLRVLCAILMAFLVLTIVVLI